MEGELETSTFSAGGARALAAQCARAFRSMPLLLLPTKVKEPVRFSIPPSIIAGLLPCLEPILLLLTNPLLSTTLTFAVSVGNLPKGLFCG